MRLGLPVAISPQVLIQGYTPAYLGGGLMYTPGVHTRAGSGTGHPHSQKEKVK